MNVLILTDLSAVAKNAATYALEFLGEIPVKFYLLNIGSFHSQGQPDTRSSEKESMALKELNERIDEFKALSYGREHSFEALYSENNLVTSTRKIVDEKKIDLIVMGAAHKGQSPFTIIGNHTYEVIKKIRCNILAVAEHCKYKPVKKMVFPVDYSASLDDDIFKFFSRPGIAEGAGFTVVEINESFTGIASGNEKEILSQISNRVINIMPAEGKDIFAESNLQKIQRHFDMIIMLGKNLGICDRFLHSEHGIYSKVTNSLPILVLHGKEK